MEIRRYDSERDFQPLMEMITAEGEEWSCYTDEEHRNTYQISLERSITYIALKEKRIIGYVRAIEDYGFYIYICDLLVDKAFRGNEVGKELMECIVSEHPDLTTYVMSDVDEYYQKLGYRREGTIFEVIPSTR